MSGRFLATTIGVAMCLGLLVQPVQAQRSFIENLGRNLLNEAVNGNRRQPPGTSPQPTQPRPRQAQQIPNESGKTPGSDPYGGHWGNIIQPQPTPRPQPRPQPNITPQPQPRSYPPIDRRAHPPGSSWKFDTYQYPPNSSGGHFERHPPYQDLTPSANQPRTYYAPQTSSTGPIKIKFPSTQSGICEFAIVSGSSEFPRSMNPGEMQQLEGTSTWKVRIKSGAANSTYRLTAGSEYVFLRGSGQSLRLYKQMEPEASSQP